MDSYIGYADFSAVEYLEEMILKKMKERNRIIKIATDAGKPHPKRGHTVKGLQNEIIGMCQGLAAIHMQIEADSHMGKCSAVFESDVRADLEVRLEIRLEMESVNV